MHLHQSLQMFHLSRSCNMKCTQFHKQPFAHTMIYKSQMQSRLNAIKSLNSERWAQCSEIVQKALDQFLLDVTQYVKEFRQSFELTRILVEMLDQRQFTDERSALYRPVKEVLKHQYGNLKCCEAKLIMEKVDFIEKRQQSQTLFSRKISQLNTKIAEQFNMKYHQNINKAFAQHQQQCKQNDSVPLPFTNITMPESLPRFIPRLEYPLLNQQNIGISSMMEMPHMLGMPPRMPPPPIMGIPLTMGFSIPTYTSFLEEDKPYIQTKVPTKPRQQNSNRYQNNYLQEDKPYIQTKVPRKPRQYNSNRYQNNYQQKYQNRFLEKNKIESLSLKQESELYETTLVVVEPPPLPSVLKVSQISHYWEIHNRKKFTCTLKVLKIMTKNIDMLGFKAVEFLGGDQTGVVICTFKQSHMIEEGNVVELNTMEINDKQKMIQFSKKSTVQKSKTQFATIGLLALSKKALNALNELRQANRLNIVFENIHEDKERLEQLERQEKMINKKREQQRNEKQRPINNKYVPIQIKKQEIPQISQLFKPTNTIEHKNQKFYNIQELSKGISKGEDKFFSMHVMVLSIIGKEINSENKLRVLCGDETGIGQFSLELTDFVIVGAVLEVRSAFLIKLQNNNNITVGMHFGMQDLSLSEHKITKIGNCIFSSVCRELVEQRISQIEKFLNEKNIPLQHLAWKQNQKLTQRVQNSIKSTQPANYFKSKFPQLKKIYSSLYCRQVCTHNCTLNKLIHCGISTASLSYKMNQFLKQDRHLWDILLQLISTDTRIPLSILESKFGQYKLKERISSNESTPDENMHIFDVYKRLQLCELDKITCYEMFLILKVLKRQLTKLQLCNQFYNVTKRMQQAHFPHQSNLVDIIMNKRIEQNRCNKKESKRRQKQKRYHLNAILNRKHSISEKQLPKRHLYTLGLSLQPIPPVQISKMIEASKKRSGEKMVKFTCIVKVLAILQKIKFGGRDCLFMLVGDCTGATVCKFRESSLIKPGNVLELTHMSNVKNRHGLVVDGSTYLSSEIRALPVNINQIGEYRMTQWADFQMASRKEQINNLLLLGQKAQQQLFPFSAGVNPLLMNRLGKPTIDYDEIEFMRFQGSEGLNQENNQQKLSEQLHASSEGQFKDDEPQQYEDQYSIEQQQIQNSYKHVQNQQKDEENVQKEYELQNKIKKVVKSQQENLPTKISFLSFFKISEQTQDKVRNKHKQEKCMIRQLQNIDISTNYETFNMDIKVLRIMREDIACRGRPGVMFLGGDESGAGVFLVWQDPIVQVGNVLQLKRVRVVHVHKQKQVKLDGEQQSGFNLSTKRVQQIGKYRLSKTAEQCFIANKISIEMIIQQQMIKKYEPIEENRHHKVVDSTNYPIEYMTSNKYMASNVDQSQMSEKGKLFYELYRTDPDTLGKQQQIYHDTQSMSQHIQLSVNTKSPTIIYKPLPQSKLQQQVQLILQNKRKYLNMDSKVAKSLINPSLIYLIQQSSIPQTDIIPLANHITQLNVQTMLNCLESPNLIKKMHSQYKDKIKNTLTKLTKFTNNKYK